MNNMDRFSQALCNFPDPEREWFWQWIAESAKRLPGEAKLRSRLCDAVGELRSGRNRPRTFNGGFRLLSRDQLHKAVLTYRGRLIPFVKEYRDWKAMVAWWLLATRQDQVVAVLDALGCPHDGKGHRLEDRPPCLEPEEATQRIMALSSQIPFADLEMITAGLLSNHEGWNYLDQAVDRLHEEAQHARETVQTTAQCSESTTMTATQFSTDPATRVQALRGQMDTLIAYLQGVVAELQAGRLPDMTAIASTIEPLRTEFTALVSELRPKDASLEGLTAVLEVREGLAKALAVIDHLECLRHRYNPDFVGITHIRQRCTEIRQMVTEATSQDEAITQALKPLCALERLINEYKSLDEVVIEELDAEVRSHFGAQMALAAVRGNLKFAELDAMAPAEPGESGDRAELEVAASTPSGATLVEETTASPPLKQAVVLEQLTLPTEPTSQEDEATSTSKPSDLDAVSTEPTVSPSVSSVVDQPMFDSLPAAGLQPGESPNFSPEQPVLIPDVATDLSVHGKHVDNAAKPREEPVVPSTTPPNALFNKLDERLRSFDAFHQAFWLDPSGQVVEAPWYEKDRFTLQVIEALDKALSQYEFGKALLFVQVLDSLSQLSGWILDDWVCAEAISESPELIGAGLSDHRAQRIREAVQQGRTDDDLRLAIFLEAVRPSPECAGSLRDFERLMESSPFHDQSLAAVVTYLFRINTVGIDPIQLLSARVADSHALSREQLEDELHQRCQQLRIELVRLWSAAGGRIERTHCRAAWKRFMEEIIRPLRDRFLATDGMTELLAASLPELRTQLRRLTKAYTRIMDGAGVRMKDRNAADRSVNELEREFGDILSLVEKLQSLVGSTAYKAIDVPTTTALRLLNSPVPLEPVEELCRQILRCLVGHWVRAIA